MDFIISAITISPSPFVSPTAPEVSVSAALFSASEETGVSDPAALPPAPEEAGVSAVCEDEPHAARPAIIVIPSKTAISFLLIIFLLINFFRRAFACHSADMNIY